MVAINTDIQGTFSRSRAGPERRFALSLSDRKFLLIALCGLLAVRLLAVFWLPFVDTTEARYVEIARKMVETGDWITPQFDYGVPFWGKPPLHTWLSAIGMKIFGIGPFGARVFILATALGILGLLFAWVRRHKGGDQALVATTVLATSAIFFGASAFVMTDMAMVLGTTLSMIGFYNCMTGGHRSRTWGRLFFLGVAIGLLAKGPVALVITLIPILPWLVSNNRWRRLGSLPWVSGLTIAAAVTLPWYVAAEIKTPGFLRYFIIGEHFERFVHSGWQRDLYGTGHAEPKGMIWLFGLEMFLPWTVFAIALLPRFRTILDESQSDDRSWYSYLSLWTISPLVLFTPAANILAAYTLPAMPAAAVLLVSLWAKVQGAPARWSRIATAMAISGLGALFLTLTVMAQVFPATLNLKTERELIEMAHRIDPDVQFTYWGRRSYSAEFYTGGKVHFTTRTAAFDALARNGSRDAVAIGITDTTALAPFLGSGFDRIGQFGRRILFVEKKPAGDAS